MYSSYEVALFYILNKQSHFVEKLSVFVRVISSLCDIISFV